MVNGSVGGGWAMYSDADAFHDAVEYFQERGHLDEDSSQANDSWPVIDEQHNYFKIPWGGHRKLGQRNLSEIMFEPAALGYFKLVYPMEMEAIVYTEDGLIDEVDLIEWWAEREDDDRQEASEYSLDEHSDIRHHWWEEYPPRHSLKLQRETIEAYYVTRVDTDNDE